MLFERCLSCRAHLGPKIRSQYCQRCRIYSRQRKQRLYYKTVVKPRIERARYELPEYCDEQLILDDATASAISFCRKNYGPVCEFNSTLNPEFWIKMAL